MAAGASAEPTTRPAAVEVPQIDGDWWQIAGVPNLLLLNAKEQEPVDFAIWSAADGSWQVLSCIRRTREFGQTRLFHRWEGKSITDKNWKPMGVAMRADMKLGETQGGLQAPFVFRPEAAGPFHMLYGDWNWICLATSDDGKTFTRQPVSGVRGYPQQSGRFGQGPDTNTRDPFALKIGDLWHVYYTAHPGGHGAVYCRTTKDFAKFSTAYLVSSGGQAGNGLASAECPFVVERNGVYYLFRTVHYEGKPLTHIYASTDPLNFGVADEADGFHIGTLPVAAPEIVRHDGQEYIAALLPGLDGIRVAKLKWVKP